MQEHLRAIMKYCKKCVMPDTRPGLEFDENGVCAACVNFEKQKTVDWTDSESTTKTPGIVVGEVISCVKHPNADKLFLCQVQRGQHGRLLLRILRDDFVKLALCLPGKLYRFHRSNSPAIMLMEPNVGTMSATCTPLIILLNPATKAKHGGRQRTRYALSEPSLTM